MKVKEQTEAKFSGWCKSKGYYRIKLQVNVDYGRVGFMKARAMPADFLVLSKDKTFFVEVKEVLKADSFPTSRFRQQFKLTKLSNTFPNSHVKCYILINFVAHNKVALIEVNRYFNLRNKVNQKSLKISKIPVDCLFNWKTLRLD